jgi:hypothetical protein
MVCQSPKEIPMRILALAILTTTTVLTAAPAPAQTFSPDYPVCRYAYRWGGSDAECAYTTMAQCTQSGAALGGTCMVNPNYARATAPAARRTRRAY